MVIHVENIEGDNWPGRLAKPGSDGRARDTQVCSEARVTSLVDEYPKAVVVGLLMSALGCHGTILTNRIGLLNPVDL